MRAWTRPGVAAAAAISAACGAGAAEPDSESVRERGYELYLARVPAEEIVFALAVNDAGEIISYSCGTGANHATHSHWFCGGDQSGPSGVGMRIFRQDFVVDARYVGDGIEGTLTRYGSEPVSFAARREKEGTRADLYVGGSVGDCATGAIVFDDDPRREPELFGTLCEADLVGQVTPVKPVDWGANRLRLEARVADDTLTVLVDRIEFGDPNEDPTP